MNVVTMLRSALENWACPWPTALQSACGMVASISRPAIVLAMLSCVVTAEAKTLAWYRFEEAEKGVTTRDTVFTNTIDKAKYPAYPGVCAYAKNNLYAKESLSYDSEHMPVCTNGFPSTIALVDPNDTCTEYPNDGAVAINIGKIDVKENPVGAVFIDDHEDLRLQNGTIEFFARIPDTTSGWRCLFSRVGSAYKDNQTTFNIYGQLLKDGNMYLGLKVAAIDGEPLYDQNGSVTNGVCYQGNANFTGVCLDNDRWHHIALAIDGTAKTVTLYIDYKARTSIKYSGDILYEAGYPFAFGAHPMCYYFGAAELIDEVRISDAVLTSDQMLGYKHRSSVSAGEDVNALFHFTFDGPNESVMFGADDMHEPVTCNPFLENSAVGYPLSKVSASFYKPSNLSGDPYDPEIDTTDVPASAMRLGLRSQIAHENAQSLHVVTNGIGEGALRSVVLPTTVTAEDLFGESCTVECFLKLPQTGYMANENQCQLLCMWSCFQIKTICRGANWNNGYVDFVVGDTPLLGLNGKPSAKFIADGAWHHVAIVYDKENDRADAYVDYMLAASTNSPTMNLGANTGYYKGFVIGGSYWNDRYLGNVWIDEVRVSRGALRPYQFLTAKAAESDLLASASFEEHLVMRPYTNFFGAVGEAKAFVAGASAPTYSQSRMARTFTAGPDGEILIDHNCRSLAFDGGMVLYKDRGLLADADEFTVEFLMKSSEAAAGAGIARVNRGSSTNVTQEVTWALSFADDAGHLALKVDTDVSVGQAHVFGGVPFADGAWHHVGMQFAHSGENTMVRLYRDAVLVGSWAVEGRIITAPRLMNFMLGAGEDETIGFVGNIDELRVSPGIVESDRFMTPTWKGLTIVFR